MFDEKTTHKEYPLPHPENMLEEDVIRIKNSFDKIDLDINDLSTSVSDAINDTQSGTYLHSISTGSGTAFAITLDPPPSTLTAGQAIRMKAHISNTGPATLNVNGLGTKPIKKTDGRDLEEGDILSGAACFLFYDGVNFQLMNPSKAKIDLSGISENSKRIANLETVFNIDKFPLNSFKNELYSDRAATKTTSESASGQADVVVDSVSGFSVGMSVDLLHSTDKTKNEIGKITSITSLTLTMEDNLTYTYPAGSLVKRDGLMRKLGKKKLPMQSLIGTGDGRDGSVNLVIPTTIKLDTDIIGSSRSGHADSIERTVSDNPTGNTIKVVSPDEEGFSAGDLILLMNKQGSTGDSADVGNHEILTVVSTSSGAIHVEETILNSYDGTTFDNQKVTIQRIPQYTTVTINNPSAKFECTPWNGIKGGVLIFACNESFNLNSGEIDAKGMGYNGGIQGGYSYGTQGEGIEGLGIGPSNSTSYPNSNINGGGGGGGGGGHGTSGNNYTGNGGNAIGNTNLTQVYFGGGGGAGNGATGGYTSVGGRGGGIICIFTETANIDGTIDVGGNGGDVNSNTYGGGGGAGGSILIKSKNLNFSSGDRLLALGGTGGTKGSPGGQGRIRLEYSTINGQIHPNTTEENNATNPDPGSTNQALLNIGSLAARHRSIVTSKPQRNIESMDLWAKCAVTTSNNSISGTALDSIISGITAGEEVNYGIGDTILIKLATGKFLSDADGFPYNPKVISNSTSGEITVDSAIPATFSVATLQRLDLIPRASIVTTGSNEDLETMELQFIEETKISNEIETEWFLDKTGEEGQDVTVEIGLSVENENTHEDAYCEQYVSKLNYS